MTSPFTSTLTTDRLHLRRLQDDDAPALQSYRSLPQVARHQSWESFELGDAEKLIESQREAEPGVPGTWLQLAIVEKESNCLVGDCGLHCLEEDERLMELGITLSPARQGRGYASESIGCLLEYIFRTLGKHRVCAVTGAENAAAASLFERLGFRKEAHFVQHLWYKGRWESEFVFAMLRSEWEAARA